MLTNRSAEMVFLIVSLLCGVYVVAVIRRKAAHADRCTARHGVGSHAEPPTMEWAIPTG
jgi:hypothetical protein